MSRVLQEKPGLLRASLRRALRFPTSGRTAEPPGGGTLSRYANCIVTLVKSGHHGRIASQRSRHKDVTTRSRRRRAGIAAVVRR